MVPSFFKWQGHENKLFPYESISHYEMGSFVYIFLKKKSRKNEKTSQRVQARTIDERNSAARNGDQPNAFILKHIATLLNFS